MKNKRILVVDDDPSIRKAIKLTLMDGAHLFYEAYAVDKAVEIIKEREIDIALIDVRLGDEYGPDIIRYIKKNKLNIPVICISGEASTTEAVEAVKLGAFEFLEKPITPDKLRTTLDNCLKFNSLSRSVSVHQEEIDRYAILGTAEPVALLKQQINQFAPTHAKVLITGETGTGKELVASQIHYKSERADAPFIIVNCSAIPATLIESTFFGHKKGAFTGAETEQPGKLEYANGGTIFLDEIGDLSLEVQNKLLRFLETGEIQKVGSNQNKIVDVRVIAATSKPLEEMVENGTFRRDLYYRLNVLHIKTPSLKEIRDDISTIFRQFVKRYSTELKKPELEVSEAFATQLQNYEWPGNIRELKNLAERCVIMKSGTLLKPDFEEFFGVSDSNYGSITSLSRFLDKCEKKYLKKVLDSMDWNVTKTAQVLEIQRVTLHNKIRKYGLKTER